MTLKNILASNKLSINGGSYSLIKQSLVTALPNKVWRTIYKYPLKIEMKYFFEWKADEWAKAIKKTKQNHHFTFALIENQIIKPSMCQLKYILKLLQHKNIK